MYPLFHYFQVARMSLFAFRFQSKIFYLATFCLCACTPPTALFLSNPTKITRRFLVVTLGGQIGTGWDQNLWSPPTCLNRADLDAALPDGRPCLLYRRCWHAIVVNSAAMSAAGIEAESVWPPAPANDAGDSGRTGQVGEREGKGSGGRVDVQGVEVDESQRPSGLFREESMQLVESAVTAPSFDIRHEYVYVEIHSIYYARSAIAKQIRESAPPAAAAAMRTRHGFIETLPKFSGQSSSHCAGNYVGARI